MTSHQKSALLMNGPNLNLPDGLAPSMYRAPV